MKDWLEYCQEYRFGHRILKFIRFSMSCRFHRAVERTTIRELIGLLDSAQWKNPKFDELMSKLPRGRADLFNLALGHVSRSFLLWTYMGMTVKSNTTLTLSSSSSSSSSTSSTIRKQFIPTTISSTNLQQQQPMYITEQLSDKLSTAKARLMAAEQEARKAKQQLEQLELEAIREASIITLQSDTIEQKQQREKTPEKQQQSKLSVPQTAPVIRHQRAMLPDILSLSDDDEEENKDLNDITKRLAESFVSINED